MVRKLIGRVALVILVWSDAVSHDWSAGPRGRWFTRPPSCCFAKNINVSCGTRPDGTQTATRRPLAALTERNLRQEGGGVPNPADADHSYASFRSTMVMTTTLAVAS